jgi:prepilin-type N-terminal cleavage/methylation domain-containing protein
VQASPSNVARHGFTLVELLVVIMILGLLSVVAIPSLSGNINARRYGEAARGASAFIARCQSRAIGGRTPRGVLIQPLAANTAVAIDLYFADTPDVYAGETSDSRAIVTGITNVTAGPLNVVFDNATAGRLANANVCRPGDAIQFGGSGAKYKFLPPNQVTMWFEDNQTPRNTPWPRTGNAGLPFKIWRQPTRGTGGALQLQKGAAIDLYWSCLGTRPFWTFMGTNMSDNAISILFDASGKPFEIVHSGGLRTSVGEPIFLLLGEADLAGNQYDPSITGGQPPANVEDRGGANWQYGDCVWLCIDNHSGVVKTANVLPGKTTVVDSQRGVRLNIGYAGGGQ